MIRKFLIMCISLCLLALIVIVANANVDDGYEFKNYLPFVVKSDVDNVEGEKTEKMLVLSGSGNLVESIPLEDETILVLSLLEANPRNFVVYRYDKNGAYSFVEGWTVSGTPVNVQVRNCAWVVVEDEFGISVHKISLPQYIDEFFNSRQVNCLK